MEETETKSVSDVAVDLDPLAGIDSAKSIDLNHGTADVVVDFVAESGRDTPMAEGLDAGKLRELLNQVQQLKNEQEELRGEQNR